MSWCRTVELKGLKIALHSEASFFDGYNPSVGFFVNDPETKKAIESKDSRIWAILEWLTSQDCQDFCMAQSVTDLAYLSSVEEIDPLRFEALLSNPYIDNSTKQRVQASLDTLRQRETERTIKTELTRARRIEFRGNYGALMLALLDRDGYKCSVKGCMELENLTIDHITPMSKGGTDDLSNLRLMCKSHNSQKGDR